MTLDGLASLMKQGFKKNQEEMAIMVNTAVQSTQDLLVEKIDKGFDQVDKRFDVVDKKFDQVTEKINNISWNIVDVVHKEEFDELEMRVGTLEAANSPHKKI